MAANKRKKKEYERVYFPSVLGGTIVKWEVSVGEKFSKYKVLAICVCNADDGQTYQSSIEAKLDGVIKEVLVPAGNILESSESSIPIATVDYCAHEATFENLCAKCGRVINSMEKRADYLDATNGRKITLAKPQAGNANMIYNKSKEKLLLFFCFFGGGGYFYIYLFCKNICGKSCCCFAIVSL